MGAFLRRPGLDESPQFLRVLRSDTSVAGSRTDSIQHDEFYPKVVDGYIHWCRIKPGITGRE
ncbi:sugar transferase [Paraburkholderia aromaticivorans]|uniref:sugar transferase n=1 Tax=Paraburkholderia aromaticivorans TaxID=2026199 RepID=UPI001456260A|nr:sugar transferase [Paraburkholderia aromaticivorans]